ncbi:MAG: hypothetical protein GX352_09795 [Clostridiales bacterium]|nr:hypothetical protein [Clostridiales bacterium]
MGYTKKLEVWDFGLLVLSCAGEEKCYGRKAASSYFVLFISRCQQNLRVGKFKPVGGYLLKDDGYSGLPVGSNSLLGTLNKLHNAKKP